MHLDRLIPLLVAWLWLPAAAHAHVLLHETGAGEVVVVHFFFQGGDEKPWFEPYEVFAPGRDRPYQRGFVNADGEVVFRPNTPGPWRVRVATEDGHGAVVTIDVDASGRAAFAAAPGAVPHVLTGVALVFGTFGVLVLLRRRRPPAATPEA